MFGFVSHHKLDLGGWTSNLFSTCD